MCGSTDGDGEYDVFVIFGVFCIFGVFEVVLFIFRVSSSLKGAVLMLAGWSEASM